MDVMSFNLRYDTPADGENSWKNRLDSVVSLIQEESPAIIGAQEILAHMLEDIIVSLPHFKMTGEVREDGGEYSPIFYDASLFEKLKGGTFWLSETPNIKGSKSWQTACPRICTWAEFKDATGKKFRFFNTHLDHKSEEAQIKGIDLIVQKIKEMDALENMPTLLTGDFNVYPGHTVIKFLNEKSGLKNSFGDDPEKIGSTFHGFNGGDKGLPIDYIFHSKEIKLQEVRVNREKTKGAYPSDHYPVIAKISFQGNLED